jgi:trigger factor
VTDTSSSITIENLPLSRRRLRVQATSEEVKKTYKEAVREVNKSVTLPGFRKGKAPDKLIEEQFPQAIDKAWRDGTIQTLVRNGLKEAKATPLFNQVQKPRLNKLSLEEGAEIDVEFEVEPESPEISLEGFSFEPFEQPEEESPDEALESLRAYHGTGVPVAARPAAEGDLVELDIELLGDQPMVVSRNKAFYLHKKRVSPWLFEAILGKSLDTPFEATGENDKQFRITIRKIQQMDPHPLDEALWKKLGVESEEQFAERFQKEHERSVAEHAIQQKKHQLLNFLKEKYVVELPKGLIDYETEVILRNTVLDLLRQGVTEDWVKNHSHALRHEAEGLAAKRLEATYLILRTARERNVQVLIAELQREKIIEEMVRPVKERILLTEMTEKEKENRLYFEILTQKTLELLIQEAEKQQQK